MPEIYHVYLNDSRTTQGISPSSTFVGAVSADSPQQAISLTAPDIKRNLRPGSPFSLSAYSVQDDIIRNLGDTSVLINTTINIDQNPDYTIERETFSCALNSVITNIITALNKDVRFANCTIDIKKLIRCLSEILEHQKFPRNFEADLKLLDSNFFLYPENRVGDTRERIDKFRKFLKLYLAFKYNMFKELRIPLKTKDANDESQKVEDFDQEKIVTEILRKTKNLLEARIRQINNNRNIINKQQAIDSDPQVEAYRAIIAEEEAKLEQESSNDCPDSDDCYVDISVSPIFVDRLINLPARRSGRLTLSQSYLLTQVAKILASGNSVPIVITSDKSYQDTVNNENIDILIFNQVSGLTGPAHQVSIIGMSTDNDNSVTLTIQDSYNIKGSEKKNIFQIKLTNSYFTSEITTPVNKNKYNISFDDGTISGGKYQLFLGVSINIEDINDTPTCCVNS
jgi:hypothetical protein